MKRTRKGLLWASASMLLGSTSHVAAGGQLPDVRGLVAVFAALATLGVAVIGGRRHRFDVATLMLGVTQFALHLVLHRLSMSGGAGRGMTPRQAGHHAGTVGMSDGSMDMGAARDVVTGQSMTLGMTAAHALATVGSALCVVHGERILRRLAALIRPALRWASLPPHPGSADRPPPSFPTTTLPSRFGVLLARTRPLRGPPQVTPV